MSLDSTAVTVQPQGAPAVKNHSHKLSVTIYVLAIIMIAVTAVAINIVLDAPVGMWVMTLFGAFVISAIISGAAIHSMREGSL